jgi:DNA damage-inducible protein 1
MIVQCTLMNGRRVAVTIDPSEPAENLGVLLEVETQLPVHRQRLVSEGRELQMDQPLSQQVSCGANVEVSVYDKAARSPRRAMAELFSAAPPVLPQPRGRGAMAQLFSTVNPTRPTAPADALDPLDPDYQRKLYDAIQMKNLEENLEQTIEYTPEAFGRVVMLYVPAAVNKCPITAFVDSGAQTTIMSERMAEQCNILRLLDRRFQGVAKGVGECRILGRVHMVLVQLGSLHLPMSITILERQDMDFLIGLDQLKRHQMIIDLRKNVLRIQEEEIPFLGEGELPEHLRRENAGEGGPNPAATIDAAAPPHEEPVEPMERQEQALPTVSEETRRVMEICGVDEATAFGALEASGGDVDGAVNILIG